MLTTILLPTKFAACLVCKRIRGMRLSAGTNRCQVAAVLCGGKSVPQHGLQFRFTIPTTFPVGRSRFLSTGVVTSIFSTSSPSSLSFPAEFIRSSVSLLTIPDGHVHCDSGSSSTATISSWTALFIFSNPCTKIHFSMERTLTKPSR